MSDQGLERAADAIYALADAVHRLADVIASAEVVLEPVEREPAAELEADLQAAVEAAREKSE